MTYVLLLLSYLMFTLYAFIRLQIHAWNFSINALKVFCLFGISTIKKLHADFFLIKQSGQ